MTEISKERIEASLKILQELHQNCEELEAEDALLIAIIILKEQLIKC